MPPRPGSGTCANCGAAVPERFCGHCGQEDRPLDPTLRALAFEFWDSFTSFDGKVPRTLRYLFLSPGFLTKEYRNGRRARWPSPVRLYLVASLLFFAVSAVLDAPAFDIDINLPEETEEAAEAFLAEQGFSPLAEIRSAMDDAEGEWMPRVMILMMPVFAVLVFLARPRSGYRFPHHVVFALHAHAACLTVLAVVAILRSLLPQLFIYAALGWVAYVYPLAYLSIGLRTAYGGSYLTIVPRAVIICVLYWLMIVALAMWILLSAAFAAA